jgi:16S rRNA (guanine527-N7)-methyltransferase
LSAPSDEAVDRLLVEPVAAAVLARGSDRRLLDIGSGGGSPAVPLTIALQSVEMTMVEVRAKKAAFLREVVRSLNLPATVEAARVEDVARVGPAGAFDLVTFRAVRADQGLWEAVDRLLGVGGRVLWFGGEVGQNTNINLSQSASVGTVLALDRSA